MSIQCPKCGNKSLNTENSFGSSFCESCGWIDSAKSEPLKVREWIKPIFRWTGVSILIMFFITIFIQFFLWKQYSFEVSYLQLKQFFGGFESDIDVELGSICNTLGDFECSAKYFYNVVNHDPNHKAALANLALSLAKIEKWRGAKPNFEAYFSLGGSAYDVVYWYGRTLYELGAVEKGLDWYYYALKLNSSYKLASETLVELLLDKKDIDGALSLIGALTWGEPENNKIWQRGLDSERFLNRPLLKEEEASWLLPSFDSLNYYLPVILKSNARIRFFTVSEEQKENYVSLKTLDELLINLPKGTIKESRIIDERQSDIWKVTLSGVKIGAWQVDQVEFIACAMCRNVLGKTLFKSFKFEKWTQFKTNFLQITHKNKERP